MKYFAMIGFVLLTTVPGWAAVHCPQNGATFAFSGKIKDVDTTKAGQTFYNVYANRCSGTEDTIAVYPPFPAERCAAGVMAHVSGRFSEECSENDIVGPMCLARVDDATVSCTPNRAKTKRAP